MTKLHTKNSQMISRRAVAPVIATLLLVAIAVVGGSIIFVFSQGFFSSAQISGSPQIESLEITGYDASDVLTVQLHDGLCTAGCNTTTATDGLANNGLVSGERVAVYVQNQSAQRVTLAEVSVAGNLYDYSNTSPLALYTVTNGTYAIVTSGNSGAAASVQTDNAPFLEAGQEATLLFDLQAGVSSGRDVQFKVETGTGAIFVGTILAGQQSG
jgi:flagellin-like protein